MSTERGAGATKGTRSITCQTCGKAFRRKGKGRQVHCSTSCRKKAKADRERAAYHQRMEIVERQIANCTVRWVCPACEWGRGEHRDCDQVAA